MTARALIIDCDPGVDDAIALLLALARPDALDVRAITTVAGNVGPALTVRNACLMRELAGRAEVPVFAGAEGPLVRAPIAAEAFHGESGLGRLPVRAPARGPQDGHAATEIVRIVMDAAPGSVDLVLIGPMTNLALALRLEPRIAGRVGRVVAMAGARAEGGNITASSEYNVHADPHAAHIVLSSGAPLTLIGLDATHRVRSTPERTARIGALPGPRAAAVADLLGFSNDAALAWEESDNGAPLHDPCTIAFLLRPDLFETRPADIRVELSSPLTLGHTAVELRARPDATHQARWVTRIDAEGVFALLEGALS